MNRYPVFVAAVCLSLSPFLEAAVHVYDFGVNPSTSSVNAALTVSGRTSGSLIGDFDPLANPGGTHTKPGLVGTFLNTENLPVPARIDPTSQGNLASSSAGRFGVCFDLTAGVGILSGLSLDLLADGPIQLPATGLVGFDAFRTKSPTSTYIALSQNTSLGMASISDLTVVQTADAVSGALTPLAGGRYGVDFSPSVIVTGQFAFQGTSYRVQTAPVPMRLIGTVAFINESANLEANAELDFVDTQQPLTPMPPFALAMPTMMPAGYNANVVFNLTLQQSTTSLEGGVALSSRGALVPEPASFAWLALGALALMRRRSQPLRRSGV